MRTGAGITRIAASIALVMALAAFVLGSAPFTPALALAAVAIPIALTTFWFGMRRFSIVTIYWAVAAFLSVPLSDWLSVEPDIMLVTLAVAGVILPSILFFRYVRAKPDG